MACIKQPQTAFVFAVNPGCPDGLGKFFFPSPSVSQGRRKARPFAMCRAPGWSSSGKSVTSRVLRLSHIAFAEPAGLSQRALLFPPEPSRGDTVMVIAHNLSGTRRQSWRFGCHASTCPMAPVASRVGCQFVISPWPKTNRPPWGQNASAQMPNDSLAGASGENKFSRFWQKIMSFCESAHFSEVQHHSDN